MPATHRLPSTACRPQPVPCSLSEQVVGADREDSGDTDTLHTMFKNVIRYLLNVHFEGNQNGNE